MKKWLCILLAALLVFALAACGDELDDGTRQDSGSAQTEVSGTADDGDAEEAPGGDEPASQTEGEAGDDSAQAEQANNTYILEDEDAEEVEEAGEADAQEDDGSGQTEDALPDENGTYTSKEDVALYIHTYGHLPNNFITKKQAQALGWSGGSLEPYAPGMCIGGSHFGNFEGLLPEAKGRSYTECDIDTLGASSRGGKRIVFSNDGLIYYTGDHYESFELLYGDENQ